MDTNRQEMQEKQNVEQKLLEAAEKVFLEKGYARTKTTDIAKEAGVTHAMIHYYFRSKENLFLMVFKKKIKLMKDIFSEFVLDGDISLEERISGLIDRHFDALKENYRLPLFILNELVSNSEMLSVFKDTLLETYSDVVTLLQKELDAEADKGKINRTDAGSLVIDIISLNAFTFMISPLITNIRKNQNLVAEDFLACRKEEIKKLIINRLKK